MKQFEDIDILEIIPQREPFVFVDKLLELNNRDSVTEYTVREDNLFVENGFLSTAGLVEIMAQSCAARTGYIAKYILKVPVKIGIIGNVRNLKVYRNPSAGETLRIRVHLVEDVFGISLDDVVVSSGTGIVASASLKNAVKE